MYNLFVSASETDWEGEPVWFPLLRCIREYTDDDLVEKFQNLDEQAVAELRRFPCIFAYEIDCEKSPKFGYIKTVYKRRDQVLIQYVIENVNPFLTYEDLGYLSYALDFGNWELRRTHWAVKKVDLVQEIRKRGITLPIAATAQSRRADVRCHIFDVALSFPGEARSLVEKIAQKLESQLGPDKCFYDNYYKSQLAQPSLDNLLQDLYRNRSKLLVVFLSADYQRKEWCGIEFRAIREIIMKKNYSQIMYVKLDDGEVEGVFRTDGYVDARQHSPEEIAEFIVERVQRPD